jgi:F-type H+-transporting ATPase subunit b
VQLSWSTFLLEIINFLVLVWILKRFFFRPVQEMIERRRAGIDKRIAEAKTQQTEAADLLQQYQGRLADWEQERQQARETLRRELEAERARGQAALEEQLAQAREKAQVADERRQADIVGRAEVTALLQGAEFASRLLRTAAGPETEARLIEMAIDELQKLPEERAKALRNNHGDASQVEILSAFPLSPAQRQRLEQALSKLITPRIPLKFAHQPELLAGLRITLGAWVVDANLKHELKDFASFAHGEPGA